MTLTITHTFVNPISDDPSFPGTKPSDWNNTHTINTGIASDGTALIADGAGGATTGTVSASSIGASGIDGSLQFSTSGILNSDNNNLYIQDNALTPQALATNTNVALSVNVEGDFTGTDAINIYGQYDAFLLNSQITNSLTGLNTDGAFPGYTSSSARGTAVSPSQLQTGDMTGGYFGFGAQGASSPTYQNLGGMGFFTTGSNANNLGGELRFYTKGDGGSLTQQLSIGNNGNVTLNSLTNGIIKSSSGLLSNAIAGTDYQAALTNPVTGTGVSGQLSFWNSTTTQTGDTNLTWDNTNKWLGIGGTPNASLTIESDSLGGIKPTNAQGIVLQNTTAAASGAQQVSPGILFSSFGWGTTAGTSQSTLWNIFALPIQGTIPSVNLIFSESITGGAFVNKFVFTSAGGVTLSTVTASGGITTVGVNALLSTTRTAIANVSTDGLISANTTAATSAIPAQWAPRLRFSGTAWDGTASRTDDFIVENQVVNGSGSTTANLVFSSQINAGGYNQILKVSNTGVMTLTAPLVLKGYTVATLPAGTQGMTAFVTDALAPTFLATVVGGGTVVTPVFYNGTNWVGY